MQPLLSKKPKAIQTLPVNLDGLRITPEREESLGTLEEKLNYRFQNRLLLHKALIHPSATVSFNQTLLNNERMEFLGDAVLGLAVSDYLMQAAQEFSEGDLSSTRASIVNKTSLHELAKKLEMPEIILVGNNERNKNIHHNPSVMADACEAVFAAIYIDGGYESAATVIISLVKEILDEMVKNPKTDNYKGLLQQWTQKKYKNVPEYRSEGESGPAHKRTYFVACWIEGKKYGKGEGLCKKDAEQSAAEKTVHLLNLRLQ